MLTQRTLSVHMKATTEASRLSSWACKAWNMLAMFSLIQGCMQALLGRTCPL